MPKKQKRILSKARPKISPRNILIILAAILAVISLIIIIVVIKASSKTRNLVNPSSAQPSNSSNNNPENGVPKTTTLPTLEMLLKLPHEKILNSEYLELHKEFTSEDYKQFVNTWLPNKGPEGYNKQELAVFIIHMFSGLQYEDIGVFSVEAKNIPRFIAVFLVYVTSYLEILINIIHLLENLPNEFEANREQIKFIIGYGEMNFTLITPREEFIQKYSSLMNEILQKSPTLLNLESDYYKIRDGINNLTKTIWKEKSHTLILDKSTTPKKLELKKILDDPYALKAYISFHVLWVYFILFEDDFFSTGELKLNATLKDKLGEDAAEMEKTMSSLENEEIEILKGFVTYLKIWSGLEVSKSEENEQREMNIPKIIETLEKINGINLDDIEEDEFVDGQ